MSTAMMVDVRCKGTRKDGTPCNRLLIYVDAELLERKVVGRKQSIKCTHCGRLEDFSRWA